MFQRRRRMFSQQDKSLLNHLRRWIIAAYSRERTYFLPLSLSFPGFLVVFISFLLSSTPHPCHYCCIFTDCICLVAFWTRRKYPLGREKLCFGVIFLGHRFFVLYSRFLLVPITGAPYSPRALIFLFRGIKLRNFLHLFFSPISYPPFSKNYCSLFEATQKVRGGRSL